MASNSETGHSKNVATFEDLVSFCTAYGPPYNPSKPALKLASLNTQLAAANAALQAVKVAKTAYDNATNAREIAFKPLRPLATKIVNAIAATEATAQTVADVKSINNKIQGKRVKAIEQPDAEALAAGAELVKTASVAQQSYNKMVDHYAQLVATLTAEPKYLPNEPELKVATLNTLLTDLRAKNTAVINATTALSNARIARGKALYAEITGLMDVAQAVKLYVKSLFGATSPQYRQVGKLRFTKRLGD